MFLHCAALYIMRQSVAAEYNMTIESGKKISYKNETA